MTRYLNGHLISGVQTLVGKSYNIGQIISSLVPLKDASLHLIDGTLIRGNGIYSDFVDKIGELYDNTPKYSNITKVGSFVDSDGVLSGFSVGNYAKILPTFNPNSSDWELVIKTHISTATDNYIFASNTAYYFVLYLNASGKVVCSIGDGSSFIASSLTGTTTIQANTDYYFKISYNGTKYSISISTDGETWNEEASYTGSINVNGAQLLLGTNRTIIYTMSGSIDLNGCYININDSRWWSGRMASGFTEESAWQTTVNTYGVCGKFVYDSIANTVRLPKITGILEGTTDATALGDLVEAGLPNIYYNPDSNFTRGITNSFDTTNSPFIFKSNSVVASYTSGSNNCDICGFDASKNNSIYGNSSTVQPQTIKVLYYIVIATTTKTDIQVDIDEIATDLNGKADTDLSNVPSSKGILTESYVNGTSWYRVYSDGWCEQGGRFNANNTTSAATYTVNLLKPYIDTNYSIITCNYGTHADAYKNGASPYSFTTSSFIIQTYNNDALQPIVWEAKGYIS